MPIQVVEDTLVYLESELLIDTSGSPVTTKINADWTKSCKKRGAATTVTLTITHDANGIYDITGTFTETGTYYANYSVVVDGITQRFTQTVQVVTAAQADPATGLAALPVGGTSGTWGAALALVRSNVVDGVVPEALDASLRITQGHDYLLADDRHFLWTTNEAATWPTLTGAAIEFVIDQRIRDATAPGAVVQATGVNKSVRVELTQSFTRALRTGRFVFGVEATLASGSRIGLVGGTADVVTV